MSGSTPNTVPEAANKTASPDHPDYSGYLHVAAGVIEDQAGRILLARRPAHLHQGGLWEFPGGKVEPDEDAGIALIRELGEELGINVTHATPLIRIPYRYPDRCVLLDVWRVDGFDNVAHGAEGQEICWVEPAQLREYEFPAANGPIVTAAMLPNRYLITPDPGDSENWPPFLAQLDALIRNGISLIQFRAKSLSDENYRVLARELISLGRDRGATIILNTSLELAQELDADGVHLNSNRLRQLKERPVAKDKWISASCHNLAELRQAMAIDVDFAVLSPIMPTSSHPDQEGMGWDAFHLLSEQSSVPVYALGGMVEGDIKCAQAQGGQGIAAISALWQPAAMRCK